MIREHSNASLYHCIVSVWCGRPTQYFRCSETVYIVNVWPVSISVISITDFFSVTVIVAVNKNISVTVTVNETFQLQLLLVMKTFELQ